ncbi:unnamed protein product [Arctia plantaginis]|uniref:Uncharacterized protein n=1 Tax=Arctia plantaginis TaxID=874455 RepID=A0A8S1B4A9_ARCPL|nr:unnamed protein product [Arctia plantaginis]
MSASQRKVAVKKVAAKKLDMDSSLSGVSSADSAKQPQPSGSAEPATSAGPGVAGGDTAEQGKPKLSLSSRDSDVATCTAEPTLGEVDGGGGEPAASDASVITPNDQTLQRIYNWQQDDLSRMPIISDDESTGSLPASPIIGGKRRQSLLLTSGRRLGVEMDAATKEANEALLRGKEALESCGNIKRECKQTALESLQTLYEITLALSDSRSRHKENLEKERSRHARELLRAERAHRAFERIGQIDRGLADLRKRQEDLAAHLVQHKASPTDGSHVEFSDIKTGLRTLSSQLDALRRDSEKAERESLKTGEACREVLSAIGSQPNDQGMAGVGEEIASIRAEIAELSN